MTLSDLSHGDVVLVHYPYSNLIKHKRRPALVISGSKLNEHSLDVILIAISSKIWKNTLFGVKILLDDPGFQSTGLNVSSTILCEKIFTVEKRLIERKIGTLPASILGQVKSKIREVFGL